MSGAAVSSSRGGGVLRITAFRRLWIGLGLSSLGDWLGLLALTAMASQLASSSYQQQNFAIAGVLFLRVLPAIVIGPLAGYIADRLDRRSTLVIGDFARGIVFITIPIVDKLWWVFVATVIIEAISLVWLPAKDATVPNLVPRDQLEQANRLSIATTYGSALPAAGIFVLLSLGTKGLASSTGWLDNAPVTLSLAFNAASFIVSGVVIATLHAIPAGPALALEGREGIVRVVRDGWAYVMHQPLIRGLVLGITGAFAAGGVVVGLARVYVADLGGGDPGYGTLFAAVFAGLALGMWRGPRFLLAMSRRRLFGFSLVAAGVLLGGIAVIANLAIVVALTLVLGFFAGTAWITGYTLLGLEVEDAFRGRTFAFVQTLIRLSLALVLAVAPLIAGLIGPHRWQVTDDSVLDYNGASITMFGSALIMMAVGFVAYHQMNDRPGTSIRSELRQSLMRDNGVYADRGVFIALEGGEGAGKSTQARLLQEWLSREGYDVVLTHEPGDSDIGRRLREILLSPSTGALDHRAEALLYAADKAEHVQKLVRPALDRGAVVVTDRYVDSTLAYQGAGRDLLPREVEHVARWATADLRPHLTVLLDLPPRVGLGRFDSPDRLEAEPLSFHQRVRGSFLRLAAANPDHYLVVDATQDSAVIAAAIRRRVEPVLSLARRHLGADA
ncbi:MAG: dTMP kinase [Nocardioidaceae bacterium]|nr:dTMP kinase [Nocardioidaceae bacterium]